MNIWAPIIIAILIGSVVVGCASGPTTDYHEVARAFVRAQVRPMQADLVESEAANVPTLEVLTERLQPQGVTVDWSLLREVVGPEVSEWALLRAIKDAAAEIRQ